MITKRTSPNFSDPLDEHPQYTTREFGFFPLVIFTLAFLFAFEQMRLERLTELEMSFFLCVIEERTKMQVHGRY